jgi:HlyD family secretion protein
MSENLNALSRQPSGDPSPPPPSRNPLTVHTIAAWLPWILLFAFVVIAWWLFHDRFERGRPVELAKVVTVRAQDAPAITSPSQESTPGGRILDFDGPTLFQASGWVEPDPLLIRATALYSGVVAAVHVLEGEQVQAGQLLATLVDDDARLDLITAQAAREEAQAAFLGHQAQVQAAEAFLVAKNREVTAASARQEELRDEADRLQRMGTDVVSESSIRQAALRWESQTAIVAAAEAKIDEAEAALQHARSSIKLAEARVQLAEAERDRRKLALDRTRIVSPVDGRIQRLFAAPGKKRMLGMDDPESATIATLYRPEKLQARIDVPLAEAAQLAIGQPVRLRSALLADRVFEGVVTRIDGQADLQRNTLQAKVRILNPADQLRPEMLCRAEFLPAGSGASLARDRPSSQSARVGLYVPESALVRAGEQAIVWAVDASGQRVERRDVRLGQDRRESHLQILAGLRPGDLVVNHPPSDLESGERIQSPEL